MFEVPDRRIDDAQLDQLLASDEHMFVDRAYGALLARAPDEQGRRYYLARLAGGASRISILQDIAAGTEFLRRNLSVPDRLKKPRGLAGYLRAATQRLGQRLLGQTAVQAQERSGPEPEHEVVARRPPKPHSPAALHPPHAYVHILSLNYACLHAPGVRLGAEGYAQLEHIAEMTRADIVYADEWLVGENAAAKPKLRVAYSPYAFVADPDMGGAIAVRRDLLDSIGVDEYAPLTGDLLLQLVAHAHSIVHQQLLLCSRSVADMEANRPSRRAWAAFATRLGAAVEIDANRATLKWTGGDGLRAAIITSDAVGEVVPPLPEAGTPPSSSDDAESAPPSQTAAINLAVRRLPYSCDIVLLTGLSQDVVECADLGQVLALAAREDVALVVPLVCTEAGRPAGGGWHCGPNGNLWRQDRVGSKPQGSFRRPGLREVSLVDSAFIVIRRELFLELGGLDARMQLLEAIFDLSLRARTLNFRLLAVDDVVLVSNEINIPNRLSVADLSDRFRQRHGERLMSLDTCSVLDFNGVDVDDEYHRNLFRLSFSAHRLAEVMPLS